MDIILVRHTDAKGGDGDIFRGQTDLDLTPAGFRHAKRIGKKLKDIQIDRIYSSRLKRAIHTAEAIAKTHDLKVIKNAKINEISFGLFDGLLVKNAKKKYPEIFKAREKDKAGYRIPKGGENYSDVRKRALSFILTEAKKYPGKTLLFVAHASLINSILMQMIDKSPEKISSMLNYGCRVFLKYNGGKLHFIRIEND